MAIINNGFIRGQLGNLVNRKIGDKNVVQTKGDNPKQTQWTKAAASDFAQASRAGAAIRRAFIEIHQRMHDAKMHNRLIKHVQRVMNCNQQHLGKKSVAKGNPNRLVGFQFNEDSHLHDYLFFDISAKLQDNNWHIHVPEFQPREHINRQKHCTDAIINILTVGLRFERPGLHSIAKHEIRFKTWGNNDYVPEHNFTHDITNADFDFVLTAVNIEFLSNYSDHMMYLNNEKRHPAAIIAAEKLNTL